MSSIKFEKKTDNIYNANFNKKTIANLIKDNDGNFYVWFGVSNKGCWSAWSLREIADKCDELNKRED